MVSGAVSGLAGGVLSRMFQVRPDAKLSFDMQTQAKAVDKAYRAANPGAGAGGKGFASPEAKSMWTNSKVVEEIENALRIARGQPDRIRDQFTRLARSNRLMRRLSPEQRALIEDVTQQNSAARVLRMVGELRNTFLGATAAGLLKDPATGAMVAGAQVAAGAAGRGLDRMFTRAAVDRALQGVSGMALPQAVPATGIGALGAGLAQPQIDPLARALVERQRRTAP